MGFFSWRRPIDDHSKKKEDECCDVLSPTSPSLAKPQGIRRSASGNSSGNSSSGNSSSNSSSGSSNSTTSMSSGNRSIRNILALLALGLVVWRIFMFQSGSFGLAPSPLSRSTKASRAAFRKEEQHTYTAERTHVAPPPPPRPAAGGATAKATTTATTTTRSATATSGLEEVDNDLVGSDKADRRGKGGDVDDGDGGGGGDGDTLFFTTDQGVDGDMKGGKGDKLGAAAAAVAMVLEDGSGGQARAVIKAKVGVEQLPPPPPPPPRARIAYTIMLAGMSEFKSLQHLLPAIYHPYNIYYIHLDLKATDQVKDKLEYYVSQFLERKHEKWRARRSDTGTQHQHGAGAVTDDLEPKDNVVVLEHPVHVMWGSFSILLAALYGLSHAVYHDATDLPTGGRPVDRPAWDYWINLSASDMPLMSQEHIMQWLHQHVNNNVSFIQGQPYERFVGKDGRTVWQDRSLLILDDPYIYRHPKNRAEIKEAWARPLGWPYPELRPPPQLFKLYKGEFWVMLHRKMADYIHFAPDNQARIIMVYATGVQVSDEEYFQTVACNPHFPKHLHVSRENMRFIQWRDGLNSPLTINSEELLSLALESGALFARKFKSNDEQSQEMTDKLAEVVKRSKESEVGKEETELYGGTNEGRLVLANKRLDRNGRWDDGWYRHFCLLGEEGKINRVPPNEIGLKKSDHPKNYPMEAIIAQRRQEKKKADEVNKKGGGGGKGKGGKNKKKS